MANYYVVDGSSSLSDGDTVNIGGVTYTAIQIDDGLFGTRTNLEVSSGDTYLMSSSLSGNVEIVPEFGYSGSPRTEFVLEGGNPSGTTFDFDTGNFTQVSANITVPEGVDASGVDINGTETNGMNVKVEANAQLGDIAGGTGANDDDVITTFAGSTVGNIDTNDGDDSVTIGGTAGTIQTEGGDDVVTLNTGATSGSIDTGNGSDSVELGDDATTGGISLGFGGATGDTVSGGTGVTVNGNITQDANDSYSRVEFGDNTTINGSVDLNGGKDTFSVGENSSITGSITTGQTGSLDDADVLNVGAGSTVDGSINTNSGDDTLTIGDSVTLNGGDTAINTLTGDDVLNIGAGVVATNDIFTGAGSDTVNSSTGDYTVDQGFNIPNDDLVVVDWGPGGEQDFLDALAAQAFFETSPGSGIYQKQDASGNFLSNQTFKYGGVTYNTADFIQGVPCFAEGTLIETARGQVAIESLEADDMVLTRDNGLQPIRWIGSRKMSAAVLEEFSNLRPIRIRAGALGQDLPAQDLVVSPQHRVLVRSKIAQKMFGTDEVLVAAKQLLQIDGIDIAQDLEEVVYFHMLFDRHEVVVSNGAETESLYTGPQALKSVGPAALSEIFAIFPELRERDYTPVAARPLASGRMGRKLAVRHVQNRKVLVQ